jgi:excisionase family DNA binding protein
MPEVAQALTPPASASAASSPSASEADSRPSATYASSDVAASVGTLRLHPDDLATIVRALRVGSPWLNAEEAADYLRCPPSRIRKLTMTNELPVERDGRRVLYHRDALDRFILNGGAISP